MPNGREEGRKENYNCKIFGQPSNWAFRYPPYRDATNRIEPSWKINSQHYEH